MEDTTRSELRAGARIRNLLPGIEVTVVTVEWHGDLATVVYRDGDGQISEQLLFPDQLQHLEILPSDRPWGFDADPEHFWLGLEARRIRLAALFDPVLAVHSSLVEPLPHQILAVYEEMLPRQPLRLLLADDPGAGKTIMAGLFIKELIARGDLERCLIICPGSLAEQWQDELFEKFRLQFEICTNDKLEASHSGNWFADSNHVIARIDKLARDDAVQEMLEVSHWDLIVVDEAHKMSATYFGNEKKETKRYGLGKLVSRTTRHFLLMTATPHNGKEEDFQLFLALLDGDRFEGRFREGVHVNDPSDLMRRLTKEQLLRFDGTRLFPDRRAYVVSYELAAEEKALYAAVTDYVRDEFNRADQLTGDRRSSVGFALTILQRRLASSPEAIYRSLRRRRERLESEARETKQVLEGRATDLYKRYRINGEEFDEDDFTGSELETFQEEVLDRATASKTLAELRQEIETLRCLEAMADRVRKSDHDTKWTELRELLLENEHMLDGAGRRRKLVIFTEHRDTLSYLRDKIGTLLGRPEVIVTIVGGMARDERRKAENAFRNDPTAEILLATDAAGEGINLQRAHLMVNYDLPWNPNRIEQRFGRIHRIGQDEVCHLWNLVALDTREGDVYHRLLQKLETARESLGGGVFDVLGRVMEGRELRDLMIEAVREGQRPEVKQRLLERVDNAADKERIRDLLETDALAGDALDTQKVQRIREDMERAQLVRMQPRYIEQFFNRAFTHFGGQVRQCEPRLYEIRHVPSSVRARDRLLGSRAPVLSRYERTTFEKDQASPRVEFVCPGHPLLDAVLHLTDEQYGGLLRNGSVLVDDNDPGDEPWALVTLEHTISDPDRDISKRVLFLKVRPDGRVSDAGFAPHIDLRPPTPEEQDALRGQLGDVWLRDELERSARAHALRELVPEHMQEVQKRRTDWLDKSKREIERRLTHEISFWDRRAQELKEQEAAGRQPRMNALEAERRADDLQARLRHRLEEIERQRNLACGAPAVTSGCFVAPRGLLDRLFGRQRDDSDTMSAADRERIDRLAVATVQEAERQLGREPVELPHNHPCYDIESKILGPDGLPTGQLVFLEVKGKAVGRDTVTLSRTQINAAFNQGDDWVLAIVVVDGDTAAEPRYVRRPFDQQASDQVASVNFKLDDLLERSTPPS